MPSFNSKLDTYQRNILHLTNHYRELHNLPPVTLHHTLNTIARRHNADLAFRQLRLSHVSHDGSRLRHRFQRGGYKFRFAAENVARGQRNCDWVMNSWMKSRGHRLNILSKNVVHMGLHVGRGDDGRVYWCQVFGKPMKHS